MDSLDIQHGLRKNGFTQAMIATEEDVSPQMVSAVVNKKAISDKIMKNVSRKLGKDHRNVFPEYYLAPPKRKTSKGVVTEVEL